MIIKLFRFGVIIEQTVTEDSYSFETIKDHLSHPLEQNDVVTVSEPIHFKAVVNGHTGEVMLQRED